MTQPSIFIVTKHMENFNISCWVNPRCHLTHTSVKFQKGTSHLKQVWKLPTHLTWIFKVLSGFYSVKILTNICQAECMAQILNVVLAFLVRSIVPEHCTIFILFQSWNTAIVLYATALRQLLPLKQIYPALIPGFTHSKEYKQLQGEAPSPHCNPHRSLAIAAGTGTARICRHTLPQCLRVRHQPPAINYAIAHCCTRNTPVTGLGRGAKFTRLCPILPFLWKDAAEDAVLNLRYSIHPSVI